MLREYLRETCYVQQEADRVPATPIVYFVREGLFETRSETPAPTQVLSSSCFTVRSRSASAWLCRYTRPMPESGAIVGPVPSQTQTRKERPFEQTMTFISKTEKR
jgi:hypothetical protein